jgi:hypothetical protein
VSEPSYDAWEHDDYASHRVLPATLAERLAAEAERRDISVSDLLVDTPKRASARGTRIP